MRLSEAVSDVRRLANLPEVLPRCPLARRRASLLPS